MSISVAENTKARILFNGAPLTTLFVTTQGVTDPVNVTKLALAGTIGFAVLAAFLFYGLKSSLVGRKALYINAVLFVLTSAFAVVNSNAPFTQNFYGSYGRNTGFLAYFILLAITLATSTLGRAGNYKKLVYGLQVAGVVNVLYCGWVIAFGDFLSWNNTYGNILGTLGNPDFISAFLGIFIVATVAMVFESKTSWKYRAAGIVVSAAAFYEVIDSHAIQGLVVTLGGLVIVGFFLVRSHFKSLAPTLVYTLLAFAGGITAIFGALQKGPFSFVYKTSVSLRGEYWQAGMWMGNKHPLTGIGMDSFGDWYRRARSVEAATILPGPNTVTNAAHNVVLDFFAYGGWPLLLTYVAFLVIAGVSALKVIKRQKSYDATFVAIFAGWVCYETQSIISINQIGLAIWGWIFTGALIGYEIITREGVETAQSVSKGRGRNAKKSGDTFSPILVASLGAVFGLLISIPPLAGDMNWRTAITSKDANKVMAALEPTYMAPAETSRYLQATQLFANSKLMPQAHDIALRAVKFNPDSFDSWKILNLLPNSTQAEKDSALKNMKRLDPHNPDVTAIKK